MAAKSAWRCPMWRTWVAILTGAVKVLTRQVAGVFAVATGAGATGAVATGAGATGAGAAGCGCGYPGTA